MRVAFDFYYNLVGQTLPAGFGDYPRVTQPVSGKGEGSRGECGPGALTEPPSRMASKARPRS